MEHKKMVLRMYTSTVGTDATEFCLVPDNITQTELDDYAWESACQNAESFGIYPPDPEGTEEDNVDTDENIIGHFEPYDPIKHDGLRVGNDTSWITL